MTTITTEGTLLRASTDDRTLTYRLLPFGEAGRTSLGLVTAHAGAVTLPDDPTRVTLNMEHDFTRPAGRAVRVDEEPGGLVATFRVAGTTAGNDLLAEATEGLRTGISVELEGSVIRDGVLKSGRLIAAAACVRPAFPSALLVAADAGDQPPVEPDGDEQTDDDVTPTSPDTDPVDDEDDTTPDAGDDQEDTVTTTTASAPADLTAARTATGRVAGRPQIRGAADLGRLLAAYHQTRDRAIFDLLTAPENAAAGDLFAALTDIHYDGVSGLTQTITQPQWLGNVWEDRTFERKVIPLIGSGSLTSLELEGWKWGTKPVVAAWAGNKAAVPSGPVTVVPNPGTATRYAGAHDIAREYRDFGVEAFWSAYISAMTNSYAEVTDVAAGDALIGGATAVTAGAADAEVPLGLVYVVDGALSMLDIATPSWALLAEDLWRSLLLTPYEHTLQYLSSSLGLERGEAGNFVIQPYSGLPDGTVLVGDRAAATSYELPGSPIRIEAENLANGGVDEGFFGYHGVVINEPEALALVSDGVPLADRSSGRIRAQERAKAKAEKAAAEAKKAARAR